MCADKVGKAPTRKQAAPALILKIALLNAKNSKDEEKRKKEVRWAMPMCGLIRGADREGHRQEDRAAQVRAVEAERGEGRREAEEVSLGQGEPRKAPRRCQGLLWCAPSRISHAHRVRPLYRLIIIEAVLYLITHPAEVSTDDEQALFFENHTPLLLQLITETFAVRKGTSTFLPPVSLTLTTRFCRQEDLHEDQGGRSAP